MKQISFLSLILLLSFCSKTMKAQNSSQIDIKALANSMETRFEACPKREVVAEFDRKHHKSVWQKQAWGPPTDVFADAKANDSVLYPYILTIEFSLAHTYGPERNTKGIAANDTNLSKPSLPFPELLESRNRNIYLVGTDGIRLKAREVLSEKLDGTPIGWEERPSWPDACWDQIVTK